MAFQTSVLGDIGAGIPGEKWLDDAQRGLSWVLESSGVPNIVGQTFYTYQSDGVAQAGGTGALVGMLANPKVYANYGISGNALGASLTLADGTIGELVTFGTFWVKTAAASALVGDNVFYATATGTITTQTSATPPGGNVIIPGAKVVAFAGGANGLVAIEFNG